MAHEPERSPEHQQRHAASGGASPRSSARRQPSSAARPELEADSEQDQHGSGNHIRHRRTVARCRPIVRRSLPIGHARSRAARHRTALRQAQSDTARRSPRAVADRLEPRLHATIGCGAGGTACGHASCCSCTTPDTRASMRCSPRRIRRTGTSSATSTGRMPVERDDPLVDYEWTAFARTPTFQALPTR